MAADPMLELEYVALAKIVNELRFLRQVRAFTFPPTDREVAVDGDNGAAFNMATKQLQQHVYGTHRRRASHSVRHRGRGSRQDQLLQVWGAAR